MRYAIAAVLLWHAAAAAEYKDWKDVSGWHVTRNTDAAKCQMGTIYEGSGETIVLVTYEPGTDTVELGIGNKGWEGLKEGDDPKIAIDFGGSSTWSDIETRSFVTSDYHWLTMNLDGKDFLVDFAVSNSIRLTKGDTVVDKLSLKGSKAAVLELVRCAASINKGIAPDPFK